MPYVTEELLRKSSAAMNVAKINLAALSKIARSDTDNAEELRKIAEEAILHGADSFELSTEILFETDQSDVL